MKAAFLYRFAGYIDWPEESLVGPQFTIAVLGDDGVVRELERLLPGHRIKNRLARVHRIKSLRDLGDAQILYVGPARARAVRAAIAAIAARPVLIVSDELHGLEDGSAVNFLRMDRRVRFEISLTAAERCHLKISSELLSVAARVEGSPRSEASYRPRGEI